MTALKFTSARECCSNAQLCLSLCNLMDCSPQDPLSIGFFQEEYLNWVPFPFPGGLPDPGIEPMSLMSLALAGGFFTASFT